MSDDATRDAPPARPVSAVERRLRRGVYHAGGIVTRATMGAAVIATLAASVALVVYGFIDTWQYGRELITEGDEIVRDEAMLHAIEIVDLFLLATVVQVVSLGLYQLYFNQNLALPKWLKIETLDDLKSKLVGVTITVLAVFFLGRAITWDGDEGIVWLGVAVAAVITALTWFLSKIHHSR